MVILILNPAETLRKARDSQRLSDLTTLKSASAIYFIQAPIPDLDGDGSRGSCGTNIFISRPQGSADITDTSVSGRTLAASGDSTSAAINGSGWIPVDFTQIPGGSPLAALPMDPNYSVANPAGVANSDFYYSYSCNTNNTFELTANMESVAFAQQGANDKESNDGGNQSSIYETGTNLSLLVTTGVLDLQVGASSDDGYRRIVSSTLQLANNFFYAGDFSSTNYDYSSGARFLNVTIPQGATINTAYVSLQAEIIYAGIATTYLEGEAADNAATFSLAIDYDGRTRTTASVTWTPAAWVTDTWYNSPDIKTVIQEIVNRAGWASGNALVLFWRDAAGDGGIMTLIGAYSWDFIGNVSGPKLRIEYTVP